MNAANLDDFKSITGSPDDLDPEEARAIVDAALKLMMDAVHRYDGYIVQSTGDGIFALFGAPVAHEDHPQRALSAALRMQDEVRRYADRQRAEERAPFADPDRREYWRGGRAFDCDRRREERVHSDRAYRQPRRTDADSHDAGVAFGVGIHACIGAHLARLKGRIVLGSVVERFPRIRLSAPDQPLHYDGYLLSRGLTSLPMVID